MKVWAFLSLVLAATTSFSQTISLQTFGATGVGTSENSTLTLKSTFGQPIASSGSGVLQSGFVPAALTFFDNGAPIITFTQTSDVVKKEDQDFTIKVTDLDGVNSVTLYHRPIAKEQFESAEMTKVGATDLYRVNGLASWIDNMGIEFYVTATDKTSKTSQSPETGYYRSYTNASTAFVPVDVYQIGYKKEQYRIISIPFTFSNASPGAQFEELPQGDTGYRLATYDNGDWKEYPNEITNFEPGRGYWFLTTSDKAINLSNALTPRYYRADLFEMTLKPGWNQIGNPYPVAINWEDTRALNTGIKLKTLKTFDGTYKDGNTLDPFEGGFVFLDETTEKTIKIPFQAQTSEGGRVQQDVFSTDLSDDAWMLNFTIGREQIISQLAAIGMHANATSSNDVFDDFYPPHFVDYAELQFNHPEHDLKFFAKDIVTRQHAYTWDFTVAATSSEPLTLHWNNNLGNDHSIELYLYDITNAVIVNMRETNSYTIAKNNHYKIYYGDNILSSIRPDIISTGNPYPNPAANQLADVKLPIALPGQDETYHVRVDLYDAQGKMVKRINSTLRSGFHEILWKGTDDPNPFYTTGLYVLQVAITNGNKESRFMRKIVVKN